MVKRERDGTAPARRRIFVVEDHPVMRETYLMLFAHAADLDVCGTATDGENALRQIRELAPELALVDVSLPGISGLDLVAALRTEHPELRLVVVTGHDDPLYADAAFDAGADGFVRKGDTAGILRVLRQALALPIRSNGS